MFNEAMFFTNSALSGDAVAVSIITHLPCYLYCVYFGLILKRTQYFNYMHGINMIHGINIKLKKILDFGIRTHILKI